MEALTGVMHWGSPVGLGLFFLLSGVGTAVAFWGMSRLTTINGKTNIKNDDEA